MRKFLKVLFTFFAVSFLFVLFIVVIGCCIGGTVDSTEPNDSTKIDTSYVETVTEPVKTWSHSSEKDEMTDAMSYWHSLTSDDYAEFNFPYQGGSYLKITCRYMEKYGTDVLLRISKGQMYGTHFNGTNYIRVRFDDEKPQKWYYNESSDGSSDVVFLNNPQMFIKKCQSAKKILIEQEFYNNGVHQFHFHVDEPLLKNIKSCPTE